MGNRSDVPPTIRVLHRIVDGALALLTRREYRCLDRLPHEGGYLVVANHLCSFDAIPTGDLFLGAGISPHVAAKHTLWKVPILRTLLDYMGHVPIHRGAHQADQIVQDCAGIIESGQMLLIFPEGTTTHDPHYWPMTGKLGAARIALRTRCPVIPLAQWGNQFFLPRYSFIPRIWRRPRLQLRFLEPIDYSDLIEESETNAVELTERIMSALRAGVAQLRGEEAPATVYDMHTDGNPWETEAHWRLRATDRQEIRRQLAIRTRPAGLQRDTLQQKDES